MGITGKYHRQSIAGEIIKILVLTVEFSQLLITRYQLPITSPHKYDECSNRNQ